MTMQKKDVGGSMKDFKNYKSWCKRYNLKENRYINLVLFTHISDMQFNYDVFNELVENGLLTENQVRAYRLEN